MWLIYTYGWRNPAPPKWSGILTLRLVRMSRFGKTLLNWSYSHLTTIYGMGEPISHNRLYVIPL
jgi:hypothetical protein